MALKYIYIVKRSPYLHSTRNFLTYSMWDITNTLSLPLPLFMKTQHLHFVLWDCGAKQMDTPHEAKQNPTSGSRIGSDVICNNSHPTVLWFFPTSGIRAFAYSTSVIKALVEKIYGGFGWKCLEEPWVKTPRKTLVEDVLEIWRFQEE